MKRAWTLDERVFGRWTVLVYEQPNKGERLMAQCLCSCGTEKRVRVDGLRSGRSKSCGCLHRELASKRLSKHGKYLHPLMKVWIALKQRCLNPNDKHYDCYGGRGFAVVA